MTALDLPGCGCEQVDRLARVLRPRCPHPMEQDEVAALLESTGFTDRLAVGGYRQPGLFALAEQVGRRLRGYPRPPVPPVVGGWDWRELLRWRVLVARLLAAVALAVAGGLLDPAVVPPALAAVPLAETLVAWHTGNARRGLVTHDDTRGLARHLRALGWRTLTALVPPLLVATALASAAGRLSVPAHTTLLRASVGVLLAGWYGLLLLLAARRRLFPAVVLAVLSAVPVPVTGGWSLAAGYLLGLVLAAYALFDPRTLARS